MKRGGGLGVRGLGLRIFKCRIQGLEERVYGLGVRGWRLGGLG